MFAVYYTHIGPINDTIKEVECEMAKAAANYDIAGVLEANVRRNALVKFKRAKEKELEECVKTNAQANREFIKKVMLLTKRES